MPQDAQSGQAGGCYADVCAERHLKGVPEARMQLTHLVLQNTFVLLPSLE